jgi:hypothetical protein
MNTPLPFSIYISKSIDENFDYAEEHLSEEELEILGPIYLEFMKDLHEIIELKNKVEVERRMNDWIKMYNSTSAQFGLPNGLALMDLT